MRRNRRWWLQWWSKE